MALDELKERIKAEVILHEGDLFDWQWRQMGLVAEAEALGVPADEFLKLVNEASRAINPYFGRISDLKIKVTDLARLSRKKLTDAQIESIVAEAERLQLPPDFVKSRWIPAILALIPDPVEPVSGPMPDVLSVTPASAPVNTNFVPAPPAPPVQSTPIPAATAHAVSVPPSAGFTTGSNQDAVTRKVHQFLDDYVADKHIPARLLKPLFLATNFDENVLANAVLGYLSANFYAAEATVQGETLKDQLLSTDWRHLSWWETPPAEAIPPVSIGQPVQVARRKTSDSGVIGMAVVAVGLLIGGVWWVTVGKPAIPARPSTSVKPADSVQTARVKKKPRRKLRPQKRPAANRPSSQSASV